MFNKEPWSFERTRPRSTRRDPFEAEFFTGEGETEESHGRTDSLVREVLQNSLDAAVGGKPVRVRFAFSGSSGALGIDRSAEYLRGLVDHLDSLGNAVVNNKSGIPEMPFLLVEDFGTKGLTGDRALFYTNLEAATGSRGVVARRWDYGRRCGHYPRCGRAAPVAGRSE